MKIALISLFGRWLTQEQLHNPGRGTVWGAGKGQLPGCSHPGELGLDSPPLFGLVCTTIRAGPASSGALRTCYEGSLQVEPFLEERKKILMKGAAFEVVPAPHPLLEKGCEVV